jgi:hypothetical protein
MLPFDKVARASSESRLRAREETIVAKWPTRVWKKLFVGALSQQSAFRLIDRTLLAASSTRRYLPVVYCLTRSE